VEAEVAAGWELLVVLLLWLVLRLVVLAVAVLKAWRV
jgi:hypothetical protein